MFPPLVIRKPFADNIDQIDWYSLSKNPAAIDYLLLHKNKIDWHGFCANPAAINEIESIYKLQFWIDGMVNKFSLEDATFNPAAINLIKNNLYRINWETLSENPAAFDLLKNNLDKVYWERFVSLPKAIDIINKHLLETDYKPTLFDISDLCANPKMLNYFRQHPEQINWQSLSFNPDAIDLFANNLDKLDWEYVSEHPKAIDLLIANPDKINWQTVWANPAIFTYDYKRMQTSKAELHRNLLEYLYFPLRDVILS